MSDQEKHLYILDGHALAYRAYYAMMRTPLTNSKGQPTGAVYGFALYLLRLLEKHRCPYIAVTFDSPKPTFRHEVYKEYKAHREAMPDDMISQLPLIFRMVDLFNLPRLAREGMEADDIIATLTRMAVAEGFAVSLVTKDKDLMQLVGNGVRMLVPESGGVLEEYGPKEVAEKMGVPPEKIRDLLALMGDASDNVPGVAGVGPKTAIKILEAAGDIDRLLADPSCVGNPKLQAKIEASRDVIALSKELVTLKNDVALGMTLESLRTQPLQRDACVEFFKEMEFTSFLKNPLFEVTKTLDSSVAVVANLDEVEGVAAAIRSAGAVAVDTETTSVSPREARLVGISMALDGNAAWYIPVGHADTARNLPLDAVLAVLKPVLEDPSIGKIGQNLKYDYQVFRNYGITLKGIVFDTMVAGYLLDPGKRQFSLDAMTMEWLGLATTPIEQLIGKGKDQKSFADVPVDTAAAYSGEDVVLPWRLKSVFDPLLQEKGLAALLRDIEMPLVTVLADMEWNGIAIDDALLANLSGEYGAKLAAIIGEIYQLAGGEFNMNSPKQVAEVLFVKLGLPKSKKTKTGLSTDVDALEALTGAHPIAAKMLEYREVQKLLSTYIDSLPQQLSPASGRLHTSFNQTITATGRLSSTGPNLQNIPVRSEAGVRIRGAFVAPPGYVLVSADYSQIELRLLAHLSKDPTLLQAFHDDRDIHTQTASAIYGVFPEIVTPEQRRAAKTINFGLMYGMGPINLSRQLSISFREAQGFIDAYFAQFPSIHTFMDSCIADARLKGYSQTMLGRRRYLPEINADQRQVREAAERTAINTPVQGSAADIIKIAMVNIGREIGGVFGDTRMLLQVHDELIFETPEKEGERLREWVVGMMGGAYALSIPLKVEAGVGRSWREAH